MAEGARASSTTLSDGRDPQQIRHEIALTRSELGETVAALAEKADVKAQAKRRANETKASILHKADGLVEGAKHGSPDAALSAASGLSAKCRENPTPLAATGAFVAGVLVGLVTNRKR
jgi:hypothetical protein